MYKNIIFDLGGVVVNFAPKDFLMDRFMNKKAEDMVYALTFGSKEGRNWTAGTFPAVPPTGLCWKTLPVAAVLLKCRP